MPEGDTIFRTARSLGRALVGLPVTAFRSTFPLLTRFNDDTPLAGQTVESVEARGKWLLISFSGGGILASHLLMNGTGTSTVTASLGNFHACTCGLSSKTSCTRQ